MFANYLDSVRGLTFYAALSTIFFLIAFILVVYQSAGLKKEDVSEYSRLPLDEESHEQDNTQEI